MNRPITRSISKDHNKLVPELIVIGDLQFLFEKLLQTCQEDREQEKFKSELFVGWLQAQHSMNKIYDSSHWQLCSKRVT